MSLANIPLQVYGQLGDFFNKIKQGQAPGKFTNQHLKDIGFTSTNHRAFIPLLKALGFLTEDGSPTDEYKEFRNEALSRKILGKAIKEAYSDIFTISRYPEDKDKELIKGKFKSTHNTSERNAELMMKTFYSLLEFADINSDVVEETKIVEDNDNEKEEIEPEKIESIERKISQTSLHYNIQIHLPATKDIEVYNAIFKSVKEHLID